MHIVCLPPQSTHKLQTAGIFKPLKTYHLQEIEIWLKNHPNRVVTPYQITSLVEEAYLKSATAAVAAHGFRETGLFSFNRRIFNAHNRLRISAQHHELLLDISVPCSGIAEEQPTASGTKPQTPNQQTLRLPQKRTLLFSCPLTSVLFQIYLAGNKNSQQNMNITGENRLLF